MIAKPAGCFKKGKPDFSEEELNQLVKEIEESGNSNKQTNKFFTRHLLKPIFLAFFIAFFNQLSGINAYFFFRRVFLK
jgi:hypothetical protein